jgi:hypothetical protein
MGEEILSAKNVLIKIIIIAATSRFQIAERQITY